VGVIVKAVTYAIKHDIKGLACLIKTVLKVIQTEYLVSEDTLFEIRVILNELIVNAICHGNNCGDDKGAYVTIKIFNDSYLYVCVKDEGCGFNHKVDLQKLGDYVEEKNNSFNEHGRGLIIVEQLSDKLKFNKCGNKVSIIKSLR
jgi:serine/threonine-protein kinase RsbW